MELDGLREGHPLEHLGPEIETIGFGLLGGRVHLGDFRRLLLELEAEVLLEELGRAVDADGDGTERRHLEAEIDQLADRGPRIDRRGGKLADRFGPDVGVARVQARPAEGPHRNIRGQVLERLVHAWRLRMSVLCD